MLHHPHAEEAVPGGSGQTADSSDWSPMGSHVERHDTLTNSANPPWSERGGREWGEISRFVPHPCLQGWSWGSSGCRTSRWVRAVKWTQRNMETRRWTYNVAAQCRYEFNERTRRDDSEESWTLAEGTHHIIWHHSIASHYIWFVNLVFSLINSYVLIYICAFNVLSLTMFMPQYVFGHRHSCVEKHLQLRILTIIHEFVPLFSYLLMMLCTGGITLCNVDGFTLKVNSEEALREFSCKQPTGFRSYTVLTLIIINFYL